MRMIPLEYLKPEFEKKEVTREATHASQGKRPCSFAEVPLPFTKKPNTWLGFLG